MRRRTGAAAGVLALALALIGGVAVGAEGPSTAGRRPAKAKGGPEINRAEPDRDEARRRSLLDQLDDARINCELLEMEVEADRQLIRKMMTVLRESELTPIQGFSEGPIVGDSSPADRRANIEKYRSKLDATCIHFVVKSKELSRERRRVAELEARLGLAAAAVSPPAPATAPAPARRPWDDAAWLLDGILRGVETWQRGNSTAPDERPRRSPAPEERSWRDPERLLGLLRKGIETWKGDPTPAPEDRPIPAPEPTPAPAPAPTPEERGLRDAERLLDLLRRGIESWR